MQAGLSHFQQELIKILHDLQSWFPSMKSQTSPSRQSSRCPSSPAAKMHSMHTCCEFWTHGKVATVMYVQQQEIPCRSTMQLSESSS
jgi:hypothetical protein